MLYNVDMCKKGGVILARKLFCDISPTCYKISEKKEILLRNIKDFFSKEKFAKERLKEELPNIVKSHTSILIRKLHGVDIKLQENKVTNIMIGCTKINGLIVHPGTLFLFGNLWDHQKRNMVIKKGL